MKIIASQMPFSWNSLRLMANIKEVRKMPNRMRIKVLKRLDFSISEVVILMSII